MDLISKEELLDTEKKIVKILEQTPRLETKSSTERESTESLVEDIDVKETDNILVDKAEELNDNDVEEHIAEMFSRTVIDKDKLEVNNDLEVTGHTLVRLPRDSAKDT